MSRWKRRRPAGDDQGFSLMEVMVTTAITGVVTLMAVTATIQIYSGTKQIEQNSVAGDQLDIAFTRLDRDLHYATMVNGPTAGASNSRSYLEFAIPAREKTATDATDPLPQCRQLMFDPTQKSLAMYSWELPGTKPALPANLATDVALEDGATSPFLVSKPGLPAAAASPGTTGLGSEFNNTYLMVRIRFKVKVGDVVQRFDNVFTSQNVYKDAVQDQDPSACANAGRP
ncbi:prepilin-type N-terminal cleavage/methylation domain-containing protein [Actinoplanes oblitus]|uniref:Prepilin-type N-terminal cleavage/methylation domain-containing protein n=1 Tax=Actinoplanes oblitus TaxID=3040509 RepID=A0ABY8WHF9_9ACTN|nr:prepilin-type N-terminal cleavage/methylation domain-containing protein [Actinoplanes oblitus]WIM95175.1 prepilin-type N-terminal cleavage/methylation domain-containing protein [Actinoplanes oblitus]